MSGVRALTVGAVLAFLALGFLPGALGLSMANNAAATAIPTDSASAQSALAHAAAASPSSNATSAPTDQSESTTNATWNAWHEYMSDQQVPGSGCFTAVYPIPAWQQIACSASTASTAAPSGVPTISSSSSGVVGSSNDYVAQPSSSALIGEAIGSFPSVSGITSETDQCVGPPPYCTSGGAGANGFSLQLNTQGGSPGQGFPVNFYGNETTGWEQFLFSNEASGFEGVWIEFWLLNYSSQYLDGGSCSVLPIPSGASGSWYGGGGGDCYFNSNAMPTPIFSATDLSELSLTAYANKGGNDEALLTVSGGGMYMDTQPASFLNLYQQWSLAEFNVFGFISGSRAQFNAGTSITVQNSLYDSSGNPITPASPCQNNGQTGETNNLYLGSCSSSSSGIVFTEASQSFSVSASPSDLTVLSGQTATYTVAATLVGGSPAPVALSVVSGLPPGATTSFTPSSVTPSGSSTLSVSIPSGDLGDYTLTIQGTSLGLTGTTTVNLHLYDFSVDVSGGETALRGTSATYSVSLTLLPGSSTVGIPPISLSTTGGPPDATFSFSASTETPTSSGCTVSTLEDCQSLTVSTAGAPSGSLGDFSFSVVGTDTDPSGGSRSASSALNIYDFAITASPSDATVARGSSAAYTVTMTLAPGSATPPAISLSASGLPSGSTNTFLSTSVTPTLSGASTTLTVNTFTGAPDGPTALGDYALTITGTDSVDLSGGSRQGSANLHVFDFTVTLSPSTETLTQGASTPMTVTVGLVPGSSTVSLPSVSLALTGLPAGVIQVGFPASLSVGGTQSFTIETSSAAAYVPCPQVSSHGGQNLKDADLSDCNLAGYDLAGDNLMNANLGGADLQGANLQWANLVGANLASANTAGADFQGANMQGVDLSAAASVSLGTFTLTATGTADGQSRAGTSILTVLGDSIAGDNFEFANLADANLADDSGAGAIFQAANLQGADLQGGVFTSANFSLCNLYNADLSNANLNGAKLSFDNLVGADLAGVSAVGATFQGSNLATDSLQGGDFQSANFQGANMADTNLSNGNFDGADFQGAYLQGVVIAGATFVGAVDPPIPTTTTVSCSTSVAPPFPLNAFSTECTATVQGGTGFESPTGLVAWTTTSPTGKFFSPVCSLGPTESCSVEYTDTSAGTATVTATYGGDRINAVSSGTSPVTFVVSSSSTAVSCATQPQAPGETYTETCTAAVTGNNPAGQVTWTSTSSTGKFIPLQCQLNSQGRCSVQYSDPSAGTFTITASYGGDFANLPSSGTASVTVPRATTTTALSCGPPSPPTGHTVTCVATVTGVNPTGKVSFTTSSSTGSFSSASCTLAAGPWPSVARCQVTYADPSTGSVTITASYSGDANNAASSGSATINFR